MCVFCLKKGQNWSFFASLGRQPYMKTQFGCPKTTLTRPCQLFAEARVKKTHQKHDVCFGLKNGKIGHFWRHYAF